MTSKLHSHESTIKATPGDLLSDTILNESNIHTHLRSRFYRDINHTHISDNILLVLNPYSSQTSLDVAEMELTVESLMRSKQSYIDSQPHVSTLAAFARGRMKWSDENQHIMVHGESGAGKTHAIDCMLQQLLLGDPQLSLSTRRKVLSARIILEAFGGTRSSHNPSSSSRYASCIKLNYTQHRDKSAGGVSTAALTTTAAALTTTAAALTTTAATTTAASRAFYDWSEPPHHPIASSISLHSVSFSLLFPSEGDIGAIDERGRCGMNSHAFRYLVDACRRRLGEDTQPSSSSSSSSSSHSDRDHFNSTMKQVLRTTATLLGLSSNSDR